SFLSFFFFTVTAPTELSTLSLHDALPIYRCRPCGHFEHLLRSHVGGLDRGFEGRGRGLHCRRRPLPLVSWPVEPHLASLLVGTRSEEHTSELQSRSDLVCRLLLEKKKKKK